MLVESNGVLVKKDEVKVSDFLKAVVAKNDGVNEKFSGTFEDLEFLARENISNYSLGTGSIDGDVRLVHVPPVGFYTNIIPITEENAHQVRISWESRVEGEAPVAKQIIQTFEKTPASVVKLVLYRADVLARDSSRSSDAEWEIVAILSDPAENLPMDPVTMARNALHLPGGTYREYSNNDWATAVEFWQRHAYATKPSED